MVENAYMSATHLTRGPDKRANRPFGVLGRDLSGLATYQDIAV